MDRRHYLINKHMSSQFSEDETLLGMDSQYTSSSTKSLVVAAIIHGPYPILTKCCCAHDARLNGHIQIRFLKDRGRMKLEYLAYGLEFSMSSALVLRYTCPLMRIQCVVLLQTFRDLLVSLIPRLMILFL